MQQVMYLTSSRRARTFRVLEERAGSRTTNGVFCLTAELLASISALASVQQCSNPPTEVTEFHRFALSIEWELTINVGASPSCHGWARTEEGEAESSPHSFTDHDSSASM